MRMGGSGPAQHMCECLYNMTQLALTKVVYSLICAYMNMIKLPPATRCQPLISDAFKLMREGASQNIKTCIQGLGVTVSCVVNKRGVIKKS